MRSVRKTCVWILAIAFTIGLAGCGGSKLKDIQTNPDEYGGQTVTVKGKVSRQLDWGFVISDGKGELPVLPKEGATPPQPNKKVSITGEVKIGHTVTWAQGKKKQKFDGPILIQK